MNLYCVKARLKQCLEAKLNILDIDYFRECKRIENDMISYGRSEIPRWPYILSNFFRSVFWYRKDYVTEYFQFIDDVMTMLKGKELKSFSLTDSYGVFRGNWEFYYGVRHDKGYCSCEIVSLRKIEKILEKENKYKKIIKALDESVDETISLSLEEFEEYMG